MKLFVFALCAVAFADSAAAEVLDSGPGGFAVRQTLAVTAPAARVWSTLITPAAWWDPAHSYSLESKNFSLDPRPGGLWLERLPDGGVVHMTVVYIQPPRTLRLEGALGPLQSYGVAGHLSFTLTEKDGVTTLVETYDVGGHTPGGLDKLAAPVDGVLAQQMQRLKRTAEAGNPN